MEEILIIAKERINTIISIRMFTEDIFNFVYRELVPMPDKIDVRILLQNTLEAAFVALAQMKIYHQIMLSYDRINILKHFRIRRKFISTIFTLIQANFTIAFK